MLSSVRPTPALCIAALSLVVSTSGATYAAVRIHTEDIANQAVTSPKIADQTIRTKDIAVATRQGLRGKRGPAGAAGASGPAGPVGPQGPAGADGTARAYADVDNQSKVLLSKGVVGVTRVGQGRYCVNLVSGLTAGSIAPVVSIDYGHSSGTDFAVYWGGLTGSGCPAATTDFVVRTWIVGSPFQPTNNAGFTFLVP